MFKCIFEVAIVNMSMKSQIIINRFESEIENMIAPLVSSNSSQ